MGVESNYDTLPSHFLSAPHRFADDFLVSYVEPVESANSYDCFPETPSGFVKTVTDLHFSYQPLQWAQHFHGCGFLPRNCLHLTDCEQISPGIIDSDKFPAMEPG